MLSLYFGKYILFLSKSDFFYKKVSSIADVYLRMVLSLEIMILKILI